MVLAAIVLKFCVCFCSYQSRCCPVPVSCLCSFHCSYPCSRIALVLALAILLVVCVLCYCCWVFPAVADSISPYALLNSAEVLRAEVNLGRSNCRSRWPRCKSLGAGPWVPAVHLLCLFDSQYMPVQIQYMFAHYHLTVT